MHFVDLVQLLVTMNLPTFLDVFLSPAQLISKASKDIANAGLRVLDLACGKGGDLGKWAAHPDGIETYVGSDIAFGSLEHLVERMASKYFPFRVFTLNGRLSQYC